jgi:hypothetical protein
MMRAFRENTKWIFYILILAFVGWMVFDVGMGLTGQGQYGASDIVVKVDGMDIRAQEYQAGVTNAYEAYRQQSGSAPLTREDEVALQDQVVEDLIRARLLEREYRRLGIGVTDREVIEAARTSPCPSCCSTPICRPTAGSTPRSTSACSAPERTRSCCSTSKRGIGNRSRSSSWRSTSPRTCTSRTPSSGASGRIGTTA